MSNKLSDYDVLECPYCDTQTKPKKVNKDNSVTYECKECEEKFSINENGELVE